MIRKILIIVPPNIVSGENLRRIGEPLGALSIATYLNSLNFEAAVYDMTLEGYDNCRPAEGGLIIYGDGPEALKKRIEDFKPDFVGVSCMFTSKQNVAIEVMAMVKEYAPGIPVACGGMPPTISPELYLGKNAADFVIMNDGEVRLEKLINNINKGLKPEENLDGIAYAGPDGSIIKIPSGKLNGYFEVLPYPDRSLIDMERCFKINRPYAPFNNGRRTAHVVVSKGCPFSCIFCAAVNFVGRKVHIRPEESIRAELDELVNRFGVEEIQFMDDNLTINRQFALKLFEILKKYKLKWCTPNGLFFNSLDEEMIEAMAQSGCYQITLAVESASERMLKDVIGKNVKLDRVKDIADKAHSLGLRVHGLFVVGIPGETEEELKATLRFPFENNFDSVSFSMANAFKGSALYDLCAEQGFAVDPIDKVNYKRTNFIIPENHPLFLMEREKLAAITEETSKRFYEWSREKFPEIYGNKYKDFIQNHGEKEEKLKGRI